MVDALEKVLGGISQIQREQSSPESLANVNWSTFLEQFKDAKAIFIDVRLIEVVNHIEASEHSGQNYIIYSLEEINYHAAMQDPNIGKALQNHSYLALHALAGAEVLRTVQSFLFPERAPGLVASVPKDSKVVVEKLESRNDIGWTLDLFAYYWRNANEVEGRRIDDFLLLANSIILEAFAETSNAGLDYPSVQFQCFGNDKKLAFATRFPANKQSAADFQAKIIDNKQTYWFNSWQLANNLVIIHYENEDEVEVKASIYPSAPNDPTSLHSVLTRNVTDGSSGSNLTNPPNSIQPIRIEQILLELPREHRSSISALFEGDVAMSGENKDLVYGKLAVKQSGLLNQMNERIEQEQKRFEDKQSRSSRLLTDAKTELEETKKKYLQAKNQIKMLESEKKRLSTENAEANNDDSKKQLHEQSREVKVIAAEKAKAEEKLSISEKRIGLLEKKVEQYKREKEEKEKEAAESKPIILKLTKELERAQVAIKEAQNQQPKQVENSGAEKKIKMLSEKLMDAQKKEQDLQLALKKLSLKLEQAENTIKATKNQGGGKEKQLERQLEASKTKEKELLKKLTELQEALKKVKSGKAA